MSLRALIFGSPTSETQFFDPFEDMAKMETIRRHREKILYQMADEATAYLEVQLNSIADQHLNAMKQTMLSAIEMEETALLSKIDELKRKVALAQGLLIQYSDTRWSHEVTNEALLNLQHDPEGFRRKARF